MTHPSIPALYDRLRVGCRNVFLLEHAENIVRERTTVQGQAIRFHKEAAALRLRIADDLTDVSHAPVAMGLYREAVYASVAALLVSTRDLAPDDRPDVRSLLDRCRVAANEGRLPALPAEFDEACTILQNTGALAFDGVPPETLQAQRMQLEAIARWARGRVESRTLGELKVAKVLRLGLVGILVIALAWAGTARMRAGPNVALHKPVTWSSRHHASTAAPDGLVNGKLEPSYGVHTALEDVAWVMVDLQGDYAIRKIKIYNRGDGWFDEVLPAALELSSNGTDFVEVDRRTTGFSQLSPWVYAANGTRARYVRIRSVKRGYIALSEVEVLGRK